MLAGGIWLSNPKNMVMEEFCDAKQGEASTYRGRFDIWFEAKGQACFGEVKQRWPSAASFDEAEAQATVAALQQEADTAHTNVYKSGASPVSSRAVGIVFVVPYLAWKYRATAEERFQKVCSLIAACLERFTAESAYTVLRSSYLRPDLLTEERFVTSRQGSKQAYPGVEVLVCEKRTAALGGGAGPSTRR